MRLMLALIACLAAGSLAAAPLDPVAVHADLVKKGEKIVADLIAAEAAREAYDREGTKSLDSEATLKSKVDALNKDTADYTKVAAESAAAIKTYNETCGSKNVPAPRKFKTKQELEAAKAAEVARVTACNDKAMALDASGKALDERRAGLEARRAELQNKVASSNESIDAQEKRGRELSNKLGDAELAASEWLEQMNKVLDNKSFQARAYKVEGCRARREMVLSGKDLKVFHGYMYLCAGVLKGF